MSDELVRRREGHPLSAFLNELCRFVTPERLAALDAALALLPAHASEAATRGGVAAALEGCDAEGCDAKGCRLLLKLALLLQKRRALEPAAVWSAGELWHEILSRTDEIYELCERLKGHYRRACHALLFSIEQDPTEECGRYAAFMDGGLKDPVRRVTALWPQCRRHVAAMQPPCRRHTAAAQPPRTRRAAAVQPPCGRRATAAATAVLPLQVRTHEKAVDDYSPRFDDGVLPEACVTDVVRGRAVFTEAKRFRRLAQVSQT